MKTQDARWSRIRDLFSQAVELPVDQRNAFIEESCMDDPSLCEEVKGLLQSDREHIEAAQSKGPLTGAIGAAVDATTRDRREELLGSRIGPYRLTSILGHGGAGTVYLGERVDRQYSAQVAIKIVEGAALNAEISRRFKAERQILANLNHPSIARLLDAGETTQGYPYLVMEYVHGEPIDKYCDRLKLGIEERVALALRVCAAVQYAHQNLVVHRDLKPGNILVTPDGTPKLLDFGIAKLLDTAEFAGNLALTRMNDRLLTPEYASPEQILGQNVTTASDVYSLGVVFFELLTGLRPYKVTSASQLELERTICVGDVARASTLVRRALVTNVQDAVPTRDINSIASDRQSTPMRLRARLDGDLDAILSRALRKEPQHRYNSAQQLADDLQRHIAREPVLARQGNWLYYTQRFARRNALGVAVGLGFVALLSTALIVTTLQARRIAEERDTANREQRTSEAVAKFMTNVFEKADPYASDGTTVTARELLDAATQSIRDDLSQQPAVKARLLEAMGIAYSRQGQADRGVALIQEALQLRLRNEENSAALASTYINLGKTLRYYRNAPEAKKALEQARALLAPEHSASPDYADTLVELGRVELRDGHVLAARQYLDEALPLVQRLYGPRHPEVASVLVTFAATYQWEGANSVAAKYAQDAVDIYRVTLPEANPDRVDAETMLGEITIALGDADAADPILTQALETKRRIFGSHSDRIANNLYLMIQLRRSQGKLVEAESFAREVLALKALRFGAINSDTAYARATLGIVLMQRGRLNAAERELRAALDVYRSTLAPEHLFIASAEHFLIETLLRQKKSREALLEANATIDLLKRAKAPAWRIARTENSRGQALIDLGRRTEGLAALKSSYAVLADTETTDHDTLALARERLAAAKAHPR